MCQRELKLIQSDTQTHAWACDKRCSPAINTGVPITESIVEFQRQLSAYEPHNLVIRTPLSPSTLVGAKVYAPHILIHFISCNWGGCYNSIHQNFLVPHFDSPSALDYVLRSGVIADGPETQVGTTGALIFPQLLARLKAVASPAIQRYLAETFPDRPTAEPFQVDTEPAPE
ncbi:MAG TPA: hypothetical protein VLT36_23385 [Candidatus Dormibacteraeota bacterium]|nr:hypothetical protein [Candidatus Dormibacteraeota bacterium]